MNTLQNQIASTPSFLAACAGSCKKMIARLRNYKAELLREFGQSSSHQEHLVHLALNEAEALAHATGFPLLTFPMLAREKAQEIAAWRLQQQAVRRVSFAKLAA
ncbi:MAG TPA: hypothetical protein VKY92_05395 [Verrucomicrobiae bacterium]|nr:hypothetical protein [Verrucomicrobiae bacterium]